MPNETDNNAAPEQNVPVPNVGGQEATPPAPSDLAEAFAQLRETNKATAEDNMVPAEDSEGARGKHAKQPEPGDNAVEATQEGQGEPTPEPAAAVQPEPAAANEGVQQQPSADVGGSTASSEPVDYTPARQQIYQGINQQAVQNVVKRFQDNGIRMWDIADLYDKDEQSGRVTFKNPDDESRPFQSRKEAQDYIDAMNKQINMRFQNDVRAEQNKLLNDARPALSMIDFVPVYNSMSEAERQVFDTLITPYAIRDANNNIQGFNTDLNAAANQARAIAAQFTAKAEPAAAEQPKQAEQPTAPATDMATGTGEVANEEPKDLSEAFALLNKQKKESNNG